MVPAFNRWNSSECHVLLHGHDHLVGKYGQRQYLDTMSHNILVLHVPAVEFSRVETSTNCERYILFHSNIIKILKALCYGYLVKLNSLILGLNTGYLHIMVWLCTQE